MTASRLLTGLAAAIVLPALTVSGCASEPMEVSVMSIALNPAGGESRSGGGSVGADGARTFFILGGVPGTLVVHFSATTGYDTCTLNLNGSRALKPSHVSFDGEFEVSLPSPALEVGRTSPASLACTGSPLGRRDASDSFNVRVVAGVAARLEPSSLDFGRVEVGSSTSREVAITNAGREPFALSSVALVDVAGGSAPFRVDATPCQAAPLEPGGTCRVSIAFGPNVTPADEIYDGTYIYTASIVLLADPVPEGVQARMVVPMQGIGVPKPVPTPTPEPPSDPHHPPVG